MLESLGAPKLAILAAVVLTLLILAITLLRAGRKKPDERRLGGP